MKPKYDLHLHSDLSDGDYPPDKVIKRAAAAGFKAIAITDHNTVIGFRNKLVLSKKYGLSVIPGIEISTSFHGVEVHILGYAEKFDLPVLRRGLMRTIRGYGERIREEVKKLSALGYEEIDFARVKRSKPSGACLTSYDILRSIKNLTRAERAVAKKLIDEGGPAFVPYSDWAMDSVEAVRLIRRTGGIAVLAHPGETSAKFIKRFGAIRGKKLYAVLTARLLKSGLGGIECYSSKNDAVTTKKCLALARAHGLVITGGSDWHGEFHHPEIRLGKSWLPEKDFARFADTLRNTDK